MIYLFLDIYTSSNDDIDIKEACINLCKESTKPSNLVFNGKLHHPLTRESPSWYSG